MKSTIRRAPMALAALALAAVSLSASPAQASADASTSDRPCDTSKTQLVKRELRDKVNGHNALLGKLYVFDEGSHLCAVTTSAGTRWHGKRKRMGVLLKTGGFAWSDPFGSTLSKLKLGSFAYYAGRVRIRDTGGRYEARGAVDIGRASDSETARGRTRATKR
jgi:hypothetical protein